METFQARRSRAPYGTAKLTSDNPGEMSAYPGECARGEMHFSRGVQGGLWQHTDLFLCEPVSIVCLLFRNYGSYLPCCLAPS